MPQWNPNFSRVLVQAVYEGERVASNGTRIAYREILNYHEFRADPPSIDAEFFQPPPGLYCANRKKSKPMPKVQGQFKFSEEHVSNGAATYRKDVYYNQPLQFVRYERRNTRREPETFYSLDPLLSIHDFNIGVSFTINRNLGNCTVSPLTAFTFDEDKNYTNSVSSNGAFIVRLKSPESFLLLDSEYVYMANRKINGIPSDVYISKRMSSKRNQSTLAEFSFSSVIARFALFSYKA
jgi:hypothetical protein